MMELDATLVAQMINFLLLFAILNAILFRPIHRAIEERRRFLAEGHARVNASLAQVQEMQRRYQQMIDAARQQAQATVEQVVQEADRARQEEVRKVLAEGRKQRDEALSRLRQEKDALLGQLGSEISAMASRIADKVLRSRADEPPARPMQSMGAR